MPNERESTSDAYLSVQEAAKYIGVSAQTLRRWDQEGKLKSVRHPGNSYRFYRKADLEPFRLDFKRAEQEVAAPGALFQTAIANIEANGKLREPQRDAHQKVRGHFESSTDPAILQIPVGCGKTGLIATLPFGIARGRVLVIAPNLTIRKGISEALDIANPQCFLNKTRVLSSFGNGPFTALLDGPDANLHDCTESHFVVTNIQQLASSADRWLPQFPRTFFDLILVDEGHHNVAPSWRKVFERFPDAKVVSLTATPFRGDGQPLAGTIVYRYSYARAMINGYIKQIHSINVAPSEIYFTYRGDPRHHTLAEVMELREEAWFRKGVALAPECNRHIAEASIQRCLELRSKTGQKHQIIAAACSIDHARQVRALYEQLGLEAREIYSDMDPDEQDAVIQALKERRIDCIVQVQMLGEGFDHPPLSVAAIFRPFRSLSPYIQFIGRVMRVVHQDQPDHPDNQGYVISHVGLNNDANWTDFVEVDLDDQRLFQEWLHGQPLLPGEDNADGSGQPRRFDTGMSVQDEIISHFVSQSFLNPNDDRVLDTILAQKMPGTPLTVGQIINKDTLRQKLLDAQRDVVRQTPTSIPVTPQRRRQAARKRIAERANSVVARILQELKLAPSAYDVSRSIPAASGTNNRAAVTRLLNKEINNFLGIKNNQRNSPNAADMERAMSSLDSLGDKVKQAILDSRKKYHGKH